MLGCDLGDLSIIDDCVGRIESKIGAVAFPASARVAYLTGSVVRIDGVIIPSI